MQKDTFMGCDSDYSLAKIVMFTAPFDGTTSFRPGARFAGKAIRADSFGVETYSPYQNKDLSQIKVTDLGDLELPFGNVPKMLNIIEQQTAQILQAEKIPFMIGGEHLCTLGAMRAAIKKYPNLHIIHFDAHADLRDEYLGEKLSHATVMRRCHELLGETGKLHQFGIRSGDITEFAFAEKNTNMHKFTLENFKNFVESSQNLEKIPIYFSLDLDVLDTAVFPGTGTPEPGGVSFNDLHKAILKLQKFDIIACDVCELSPPYDTSGISTAAACKIIRELLLVIAE
ncbi:MAG: agmatinase [Firmicutes bacterium]|nr:agmatinase [Bacillota bacterium]